MTKRLYEGMEKGDLKRLVKTQITIDEFVSKMGDDRDIMTVGFTIDYKEPAQDLMVFCERGYDWILDADVSSGELDDGDYMMFIELERNEEAPANIIKLVKDIGNLTDTEIDDWTFIHHKEHTLQAVTKENIQATVPLNAQDYDLKFPEEQEDDSDLPQADVSTDDKSQDELDAMLETAGVKIQKTIARDSELDSWRSRAGLL